ncbi:hypothetical protein WOLCODRAFT_167517 [Wolfiporia cocos MD-104 SS10]|uniref:FHA domain-containing protein n=1 Tax=Wolfiporia cocos (strain MD-104) TaxID=742152 RepID=A0A2H3J5I9_WOLCO|nr:hypothetical protein WOLCODRAFT_167517 [Wolfiporia cocos MD-104 SS10]
MDTSDVGRYGTISLLKRLDPNAVVASYPIDDPEITIGRDPSCSIRLYYSFVSALHCKIVFNEDKKAFLVVLGSNGVLVDGCPVYPAGANAPPATVPLPNNSTLDIHKKRFRFAYPPKHLRLTLAALPPTPTTAGRRALRMSMIQSAHVFSPRPSSDPRANLLVLQSPLKAPFRKDDDDDTKEEIVLVESDHPRVVESGKDLVILDHVTVTDAPAVPATPTRSPTKAAASVSSPMLVPPQSWAPPRTPRRAPSASLHRAVLLRSAQRVALRQEMAREEEEEVEEVEESIIGSDDLGEMDVEGGQSMEVDAQDQAHEEEIVEVKQTDRKTPMSGWRKSLEAVKEGLGWAFRAASSEPRPQDLSAADEHHEDAPEEQHQEVEDVEIEEHDEREGDIEQHGVYQGDGELEDQDDYDMDQEQETEQFSHEDGHDYEQQEPQPATELYTAPAPTPTVPATPPATRPLGRFMTPQVGPLGRPARSAGHARYSMAGPAFESLSSSVLGSSVSGAVGPRRVRLVEPWKVSDIIVPLQDAAVKEEDEPGNQSTSEEKMASPTKRDRLSEEERRAIRERRRSALTIPDAFFNGRVPGSRRTTLMPASPALFASSDTGAEFSVPLKKEDDPGENTEVLFARMQQMVEGAKRRQSMETQRRASLSPRKRSVLSMRRVSDGEEEMHVDDAAEVQDDVIDAAEEQYEEDEENVDKENVHEPMEEDVGEQAADQDTTINLEEENVTPIVHSQTQPPKTPRMGDLRHLFSAPAGPSTPQYTGMRDMFKQGSSAQETPRMEGVREMFLRGKERNDIEESALEGVSDLLATPASWRAQTLVDNAHNGEVTHREKPAVAARSVSSRIARGRVAVPLPRRTPRSAVQPQTTSSELIAPADDQTAVPSDPRPAAPGARVVRRGRTRTAESELVITKVPTSSRIRHTDAEEEDEVPELPSKTAQTRSSNRKKAGAESSEDETAAVAAKTVRRTRRTPEPAASTPVVDDDPPRTVRRTRVTRTPQPEEVVPVPVARTSSARRGGKGRAVEPDTAEDSQASNAQQESATTAPAAKVRRTARSRLPVNRVKEEEDSPVIPPAASQETSRPTRERKTPAVPKTAGVSGSGAKSAPRTRTTSARRGMTEPSGKSTLDEDDDEEPRPDNKENTPEPEDIVAGASAGKGKAPTVTTRVPTATKTRGLKSVAKGRNQAGTPEPAQGEVPKTRVSRSKAVRR